MDQLRCHLLLEHRLCCLLANGAASRAQDQQWHVLRVQFDESQRIYNSKDVTYHPVADIKGTRTRSPGSPDQEETAASSAKVQRDLSNMLSSQREVWVAKTDH